MQLKRQHYQQRLQECLKPAVESILPSLPQPGRTPAPTLPHPHPAPAWPSPARDGGGVAERAEQTGFSLAGRRPPRLAKVPLMSRVDGPRTLRELDQSVALPLREAFGVDDSAYTQPARLNIQALKRSWERPVRRLHHSMLARGPDHLRPQKRSALVLPSHLAPSHGILHSHTGGPQPHAHADPSLTGGKRFSLDEEIAGEEQEEMRLSSEDDDVLPHAFSNEKGAKGGPRGFHSG